MTISFTIRQPLGSFWTDSNWIKLPFYKLTSQLHSDPVQKGRSARSVFEGFRDISRYINSKLYTAHWIAYIIILEMDITVPLYPNGCGQLSQGYCSMCPPLARTVTCPLQLLVDCPWKTKNLFLPNSVYEGLQNRMCQWWSIVAQPKSSLVCENV